MLGVRDRLGHERTDVVVVERVDDLPAVALADHQVEVTE
jgi:hypothetical protein